GYDLAIPGFQEEESAMDRPRFDRVVPFVLAGSLALAAGSPAIAQEQVAGADGDTYLGSLGECVASHGDADGHGVPDFAPGAPNVNYAISGFGFRSVPGEVQFFSGKTAALRFRVTLGLSGDDFGKAICAVGDVNGDAIGDVLVAAPGTSLMVTGYAVVVSGA